MNQIQTSILILCIIVFIFNPGQIISKKAEYKNFLRIFRYENCDEKKFKTQTYEITYFNVTTLNLYQQITNGRFRINGPLPKVVKLKALLQRCKSTELGSCETVMRLTGNVYELTKSFYGIFEEQVYDVVEPRLSIPFVPGEYKLVNFTGDIDKILPVLKRASIPRIFEDFWNINLKFCDPDYIEMSCANHMIKGYNVRVRKYTQV